MHRNPRSSPHHATFYLMFKCYAATHTVNDIVETFHGLGNFNLKDHASFSNLIDALCNHKHVLEAQDLVFGNNKDFVDVGFIDGVGNTKIYNMALREWFKMRWCSGRLGGASVVVVGAVSDEGCVMSYETVRGAAMGRQQGCWTRCAKWVGSPQKRKHDSSRVRTIK